MSEKVSGVGDRHFRHLLYSRHVFLGRILVGVFSSSLVLGLLAPGASLASVTPDPSAFGSCQEIAVPAGSGTTGDPYLLSNFAHLAWLRSTPNAWNSTVHQVANIDAVLDGEQLSCTWTTGIGTKARPFQGTFDGNGFTISNLSITNTDASEALGFVNFARGATLQSVTLVDAVVSGFNFVGGLVGSDSGSSSIKASSLSGSVMARGSHAGGLVGRASGTQIVNSFSLASVSGSTYVAGLVGDNRSAGTEIVNSYVAGPLSVSDDRQPIVGSIIAFGSDAGIIDSVWNSSIAADVDRENGLARTSAQMKRYATFADIGWRIADGWAPSMPWSICSTVNGGLPFHSARYESNPCPSLNASPAQLESRVGVPMQPVVMQVSGFAPADFVLQEGSLPRGLTLDRLTGTISGTPLEPASSTVVIEGRQGSITRSTAVNLRIRKAPQTSTVATNGPCERTLNGTRLTITCSDPGEYDISIPEGATVVTMDAFGADGSRGPYVNTTSLVTDILPGPTPGGVGGRATLDAESVQRGLGKTNSLAVVVGSRGSGGSSNISYDGGLALLRNYQATLPGGGYSAVLAAGSSSPLLVAGGGGGGLTYNILNNIYCGNWQSHRAGGEQIFSSRAKCLNLLQPVDAHSSLAEPIDDWRSQAGGDAGYAFIFQTPSSPSITLWHSWGFQGAPGASFGIDGTQVSPRSPDPEGIAQKRDALFGFDVRESRNGRVVIVLDLQPQADPAGCTPQNPQLGQTILCDRVGLSRVNVPAGADVARVNLVGAGGGSAAGASVIDGGTGAAVDGVVDVRTANHLDISVGAGGQQRTWSNDQGEALFGYGTGGGATSVRDELRNTLMSAGGGGGANGATASSATPVYLASISQLLTTQTAGSSATTESMVIPAIPEGARAFSAAPAYPGGQQGTSGWLSTGVNDPVYSFDRGSFGGNADNPAGINGFALLRFCGLPGAPTVTSVTSGRLSGQATVDVAAATGSDGGCAPSAYQFRTSVDGPWISAPALDFSIVLGLTSGQSVCVQMRSLNEAGWSPASPIKCGNARNTNADVTSGSGDGDSSVSITIATGGAVSPTTITVPLGGTFTVNNAGTVSNQAYVRPANTGGATMKIGALTCVGDGSSISANCFLNPSTDGGATPGSTIFTLTSPGGIVVYTGSSNGSQAVSVTVVSPPS